MCVNVSVIFIDYRETLENGVRKSKCYLLSIRYGKYYDMYVGIYLL